MCFQINTECKFLYCITEFQHTMSGRCMSINPRAAVWNIVSRTKEKKITEILYGFKCQLNWYWCCQFGQVALIPLSPWSHRMPMSHRLQETWITSLQVIQLYPIVFILDYFFLTSLARIGWKLMCFTGGCDYPDLSEAHVDFHLF